MRFQNRSRWPLATAAAALSIFVLQVALDNSLPVRAAGDEFIYVDTLAGSWTGAWSWDSTIDFQNTSPVHTGGKSIVVTYTVGWGGLYLHSNTSLSGPDYTALHFWIRGTGTGEHLNVTIYDTPSHNGPLVPVTATVGAWTPITIPLSGLGNPNSISGIVWQDSTGSPQPQFYLDDITLIANAITTSLTLSVDVLSGIHPISPYIYGMNFAEEALANELQLPVNRWGGNATSRYNYLNDISNHASDWYFENIAETSPTPPHLPDGSAADRFIEQNRRTGTQTVLTIPTIGWTSKNSSTACGYSIAKYGAQTGNDFQWRPDCGNGILASNTQPITANNPLDTSIAITQAFVQKWITYLQGKYEAASNGGVRFFDLDNEPMLWNSTQRDVHPQPTSYDEMLTRTLEYASAIKASDPKAQTLGPAEWGWSGYFYSAKDIADGGVFWWDTRPDRMAHGDVPFTDWYLQQMKAYDQAHGQRILDYLDLHFYPQAAGVSLSPAGDANTQSLRLRSTRSLWDPTYTDESWIAEPTNMIPRMRHWVNDNYPGTKLAISEYNWGALDNLNGALAQADVLGIFGREGLDLAALWDPPTSTMPGAYAFRLYLNYDGHDSHFGEVSVSAASTDQGQLSIYAARRGFDGALTLMIINKSTGVLTAPLTLANYTPQSTAQVYRYDDNNLGSIVQLPDIGVSSHGFTSTYPAASITLVILQPIAPPKFVYLPIMMKR